MTQERADTPQKIYNVLTNDETFMALVGKRIFKAGNTELSGISIVSPGATMPAMKSITGLEVIIHDVTKLDRREYITNDYDIRATWKVFLLAWPDANGATLNAAATRIMQLFSKATSLETVPLDSDIGAIAQLLMLIPSESVVLA
jgi:hypothetical protein